MTEPGVPVLCYDSGSRQKYTHLIFVRKMRFQQLETDMVQVSYYAKLIVYLKFQNRLVTANM